MSEREFREPDPFPGFEKDNQDDFAAEHEEPSLADEMGGGPERTREPESPRGLAGMDE